MVKNNNSKTARENKVKLTEAGDNDFNVIELSTKKASGKAKSTYVCNRNQNVQKKKKTLSVVDDYAEFDFRANKKSQQMAAPVAKVEKKVEEPAQEIELSQSDIDNAIKELMEIFGIEDTVVALGKAETKSAKTAAKTAKTETKSAKTEAKTAKTETKTAKTETKAKNAKSLEPDTLVIKEKNTEGTISIKASDGMERRKQVLAEASERIFMDEAAERVINTARMGALFDCFVKN